MPEYIHPDLKKLGVHPSTVKRNIKRLVSCLNMDEIIAIAKRQGKLRGKPVLSAKQIARFEGKC